MAHMEFQAASGGTTTEANKTAHKAFGSLAILFMNINQSFIIINPHDWFFTLSAFALLVTVAIYTNMHKTYMQHKELHCSTFTVIIPPLPPNAIIAGLSYETLFTLDSPHTSSTF